MHSLKHVKKIQHQIQINKMKTNEAPAKRLGLHLFSFEQLIVIIEDECFTVLAKREYKTACDARK